MAPVRGTEQALAIPIANAASAVPVSARFARLPFSGYHRKLCALLATCFAADAVDLVMLSYLLAPISHDLVLTGSQPGLAGGAVFVGVGIGASIAGMISDRFGRRNVLVYSMLIWGSASLMTAFSWDFWSFAACRLLTGIGLGAELPAAYALLAEFMPADRRSSAAGWMHVGSQAATVLFNVMSFCAVLAIGPALGWRAMFVAMSLVAVLALYVRRRLPESPRWYEAKGLHAEADRAMCAFEQEVERSLERTLPEAKNEAATIKETPIGQPLRDLFSPDYRARTLFSWTLWFVVLAAIYGISVWIGKLLVDRGMDVRHSIAIGVFISSAGMPGAWTTGQLLERLGRKPTIVIALLGFAITAALYGQASTIFEIACAGAAMQLFLVAVATSLYAYTPELFPTRMRATAMGTASTVGRIAAFSGPLLLPAIVLSWGYAGAFLVCAACLLIAAGLVILFGPETHGRALEDASAAHVHTPEPH
jgi:putative MFS transporter